jgi:hypothetical protein
MSCVMHERHERHERLAQLALIVDQERLLLLVPDLSLRIASSK